MNGQSPGCGFFTTTQRTARLMPRMPPHSNTCSNACKEELCGVFPSFQRVLGIQSRKMLAMCQAELNRVWCHKTLTICPRPKCQGVLKEYKYRRLTLRCI